MKAVLLLIGILGIYLGTSLGLMEQVNVNGIYHVEQQNTNVVTEYLELKNNYTFEYHFTLLDGIINRQIITGSYTIKKNQLELRPVTFQNTSKAIAKGTKVRLVNRKEPAKIIDLHRTPNSFRKSMSAFESGAIRLQPAYRVKQLSGKLSLCLQDFRTGFYSSKFSK